MAQDLSISQRTHPSACLQPTRLHSTREDTIDKGRWAVTTTRSTSRTTLHHSLQVTKEPGQSRTLTDRSLLTRASQASTTPSQATQSANILGVKTRAWQLTRIQTIRQQSTTLESRRSQATILPWTEVSRAATPGKTGFRRGIAATVLISRRISPCQTSSSAWKTLPITVPASMRTPSY